ncbi:hypothetical protein T440DRAFT_555005 [Plenodomus tracheiphilus IPT5]|uniref:Uncharacterized protein n=1 Tax=Plenodomus tracheiphilus IPT5 TaxID=1408161 RepID=A0A6A7B6R4_9PLEO|nr:hypothetical protein T440DRAFT_555005 [Plenodomus tracheiphilus IPT5]
MSTKPVAPSSSCSMNSPAPDARRTHVFHSPNHSEAPTPTGHITQNVNLHLAYLQHTATLSRHYTTLQDHADHHQKEEATPGGEGLTPRRESRREGFMVDSQQSRVDERRNSRNPLPPDQGRSVSPPPLEEILRRKTIDDADNIQNLQLQHANTGDSRLQSASRSSTSGMSRADTRRSSIAVFAKGLVSRVPDMRMFTPQKPADGQGTSRRRPSQDGTWTRTQKMDRDLSFAPLPSTKTKQSYAADPSLPTTGRGAPIATTPKKLPLERTVRSGLRDRRKVKLDLPLPAGVSNIPPRSRSPGVLPSSLTPSRPRSPKTPWVRKEQPR